MEQAERFHVRRSIIGAGTEEGFEENRDFPVLLKENAKQVREVEG